jgi:hypothetical protein
VQMGGQFRGVKCISPLPKKSKQGLGFNEWQLCHFNSYVGYKIGMRSIKIPREMHVMPFSFI